MTQLQSGHISVGTNTPTGNPMQYAVDNSYICKDEFIQSSEAIGLGITANSPQYSSGELDRKILQASGAINRFCARWFDTQTIDETKKGFTVRPYNPQLVKVVLNNRPYSQINSMYIQVLKWFIPIIVSGPGSYLQDFYDDGFCRIVPLLSSAGTGVGSPIPAAILDRVPLGILWVNYTFGYGTPLLAQTLTNIDNSAYKQYQAPLGNRLWAPSQTFNVYKNAALVAPNLYTVDYANGLVTFSTGLTSGDVVTSDFTTNDSLPAEIKYACTLLVAHYMGQAASNPLGATSMGIQTYNINFGEKSYVMERVKEILQPYANGMPIFF